MFSYEDIILLGEERVLVIQDHGDGRCWCGETWDWPHCVGNRGTFMRVADCVGFEP